MAHASTTATLNDLEAKLVNLNLRGQWQIDANRPQNVCKGSNGAIHIEPAPSGKAHIWRWRELEPILQYACEAMPDSYTARRALILTNPGLPRGTTHTLLASLQIVRSGEIAWAHRHTINALRFSIQGGAKTYTVVEGRRLNMEPYDLLVTPGWTWHDHHNESDQDAIWLDGLDVPFTLALNQNFYEELGDVSQEISEVDSFTPMMVRAGQGQSISGARPYRYAWAETKRFIEARSSDPANPLDGHTFEFVNPETGSSVLPTIGCGVQVLPPGFEGRIQRHTSSSVAFVIQGDGWTMLNDVKFEWGKHDSFALPNWAWYRLVNASRREPAVLFTMNDSPILRAFGYYRQESEDNPLTPQLSAKTLVRPATE